MDDTLYQDLRIARRRMGPFAGTVYLTCDNVRCSVREVELRVREGAPALPFQAPLLYCRCRQPLTFHALDG
jgi:hypothetical protein